MKGLVFLFVLFTFVVSQVPSPDKWRTIDGYGNNIQNPTWGTPGRRLARESKIVYGDGISSSRLSVNGGPLPNPRVISNTVHSPPPSGVQPLSPRAYTDLLTYWGQFIDHDLDLTGGPKGSAVPLEPINIPIPPGDPFFGPFTYTSGNVSTVINTTSMVINRSVFDPTTGTTVNGTPIPRQQITLVTSYLDGSTIYGSDNVTASFLRSYSGGLLKTTIFNGLEYAPLNSKNLTNENDPNAVNDTLLFLFGDVRGNENPALVALHTLFLREHNRRARELASWYSHWTDEELYQEARRYVIALIQRITFEEYLPITVGDGADPYNGYNASVDATVPAEFSTGAFRYGHSEVSEWIWRIDGTGNVVPQGHLHLRDTYFNSSNTILPVGIEPILLGMAGFTQNAVDIYFIDDLRNYLFGKPGFGGLDLASVNIQRGRDHGLPGFNDYRAAYGLAPYTSWDQINPDPAVWQRLAAVYTSIDDCDVYTCGLAEYHNYSNVGETFATVINTEYDRFRDGDRFWYENNQWNATDFQEIWGTQLRDVILRNTPIQPEDLQCFVMAAPDACGKVPPPPPPAPVLFKHYDFNVTVQKKTPAHPHYGVGSVYGFVVNGVEGGTITMVRGNIYVFNIQSSCAHSFVLSNVPEPGQETPGGYTPIIITNGDVADGNLVVLYQFGCANENHEMAIVVSSAYPNYIYYQCDFHTLMGGLIHVVDPPTAGSALLQPFFILVVLLSLLFF